MIPYNKYQQNKYNKYQYNHNIKFSSHPIFINYLISLKKFSETKAKP